jgi:hypothetical protein
MSPAVVARRVLRVGAQSIGRLLARLYASGAKRIAEQYRRLDRERHEG